jgi:radical SAM superfamily enzyme YgiQ (UPF0313 family)
MYKGKRFSITSEETVWEDIEEAAHDFSYAHRLFLCDGDALILPQAKLVGILERIKSRLPQITRVGIYANHKSIKTKTVAQLQELRELGLKIAYMGLESGDDSTLIAINKGATASQMIEAGKKIKEAGIRLSVTVLLGIAGLERSTQHAIETGRVLSAIDPNYVGALSLMLTPETPLYAEYQAGRFALPKALDIVQELRTMIAATDLSQGLFHANHASNYLPIRARLPRDKQKTLALIDQALNGQVSLKPEFLRAL